MRGGALYGMGIHGRVIDIASSDPSDHDTLHSFLSDAEQHEWALYVGTDSGYREVRASAQSPLSRSVMRACRLNGRGSGSGSGSDSGSGSGHKKKEKEKETKHQHRRHHHGADRGSGGGGGGPHRQMAFWDWFVKPMAKQL